MDAQIPQDVFPSPVHGVLELGVLLMIRLERGLVIRKAVISFNEAARYVRGGVQHAHAEILDRMTRARGHRTKPTPYIAHATREGVGGVICTVV